jgi:hypothetical protein
VDIQGEREMKKYKQTELFLLFFGGALLILHAIAICVRLTTGVPSEQITSTNNVAILIGQIAAMLCFLGVGLGLLGLAWEKRRSSSL